jgi:sulfatase maturation enzyme AslB (radical SAM superfamily)
MIENDSDIIETVAFHIDIILASRFYLKSNNQIRECRRASLHPYCLQCRSLAAAEGAGGHDCVRYVNPPLQYVKHALPILLETACCTH